MEMFFSQQIIPQGTRRTVRLIHPDAQPDIEIFFDIIGEELPEPRVLDGFVMGVIFYLMLLGQTLYVRGPMSKEAIYNLSEFQDAWVRWKPNRYRKIEIIPAEIVSPEIKGNRQAIAAFSGGVDSVFTILRHNCGNLGNASYPLSSSVLMVHGFDVPLSSPEQFASLNQRTKPLLDELGLRSLTIRTNLKEANLQDWEDSFMSQLSCCLHNYSNDFSYALVGSSEPYDALVLPWGSNPATDYLLSGSEMRLVHDGAGFSRTEKVAFIASNRTASRVLKVCWEGAETDKNCGICEKCIRTKANFLAVGVAQPECFDTPLKPRQIRSILLRNVAQCAELESIIAYAKSKDVTGEWLKELEAKVKEFKSPMRRLLSENLRRMRKILAMLARGDVGEVAVKIRRLVTARNNQ